jgi:hypothetical protein
MFVVLANATFASYFQGGGHWTWLLQYPLGLKQLGHRVFWLEVMRSTDNAEADSQAVRNFFQRMAEFDLEPDAAVPCNAEYANAEPGSSEISRAQRNRASSHRA